MADTVQNKSSPNPAAGASSPGGAAGTNPANGAITVTWDDLKSRKVDTRLKEQDALARNRAYAGMAESALEPAFPARAPLLARLWNNSVVALAVFGLVGGVLAWACGASLQFRADAKADADARMREVHRIDELARAGRLPQSDADVTIEHLVATGRQANQYFAVLTDPKYGDTKVDQAEMQRRADERERRLAEVAKQDQLKQWLGNMLGYGAAGVMIALFLAIALPVTERNVPAAVINGSVGAALGLAGGIAVSLFVDKLYNAVAVDAAGQTTQGRQVLARVAVWGALGLFLTVAPGIVMRNWKKFAIGLLGGLIGGLIGGVLYDPVAAAAQDSRLFSQADRLATLVAMAAIGLVAGLTTGLIENVAKTGWLRVTQGLIAGKQFILYRNPTFVGSGPDCQIYLFRDPKVGRRHAAIHIVPGGFELEDLPLGEPTFINGKQVARTRMRNGDRIQVGATQLVFQERAPAA